MRLLKRFLLDPCGFFVALTMLSSVMQVRCRIAFKLLNGVGLNCPYCHKIGRVCEKSQGGLKKLMDDG